VLAEFPLLKQKISKSLNQRSVKKFWKPSIFRVLFASGNCYWRTLFLRYKIKYNTEKYIKFYSVFQISPFTVAVSCPQWHLESTQR